jgi:hypothetical protein
MNMSPTRQNGVLIAKARPPPKRWIDWQGTDGNVTRRVTKEVICVGKVGIRAGLRTGHEKPVRSTS